MQKILGIDNNAKTIKGRKKQYSTAIIYLAPSNASGVTNTCTSASKECRKACLFTSGRGRMSPIQEARINKTKFLVNDEETFLRQLWKETEQSYQTIKQKGFDTVRTSQRHKRFALGELPIGRAKHLPSFPRPAILRLHKTSKQGRCLCQWKVAEQLPFDILAQRKHQRRHRARPSQRGVNVAVVYWKHLPETDFGGFEVINGDENDLRFADPLGKVVGLKYKPSVADNPQDMKFIRKTQTLVTV